MRLYFDQKQNSEQQALNLLLTRVAEPLLFSKFSDCVDVIFLTHGVAFYHAMKPHWRYTHPVTEAMVPFSTRDNQGVYGFQLRQPVSCYTYSQHSLIGIMLD